MAALGRRPRAPSSRYSGIFPVAKAGNFPWRFPGSLCGDSREFRLTENRDPEILEEIAEIYAAVSENRLSDARSSYDRLKGRIGDDPEVTRIAAVIKRKEVLGK